jgi:hypothetical protein
MRSSEITKNGKRAGNTTFHHACKPLSDALKTCCGKIIIEIKQINTKNIGEKLIKFESKFLFSFIGKIFTSQKSLPLLSIRDNPIFRPNKKGGITW